MQQNTPAYTRSNKLAALWQALSFAALYGAMMCFLNILPAVIVANAAGLGFGSLKAPEFPEMTYLMQVSIFCAGVVTLIQSFGVGPLGARLPLAQGTHSFFVPVMVAGVMGQGVDGLAALMGAVLITGIFMTVIGALLRIGRFSFTPLLSGLVIFFLGFLLLELATQYIGGGRGQVTQEEFGGIEYWLPAMIVMLVSLRKLLSPTRKAGPLALLAGLIIGYLMAWFMYQGAWVVNLGGASQIVQPDWMIWGLSFSWPLISAMCLTALVVILSTIGVSNGVCFNIYGRLANNKEISGSILADGFGNILAACLGGMPNSAMKINIGISTLAGRASRLAMAICAVALILFSFLPAVSFFVLTLPESVLGGALMVVAGIKFALAAHILSYVRWDRRNRIIFGVAMAVGIGLKLEPELLQHLGSNARVLLLSGLLPAVSVAVIINFILPSEDGRSRWHDIFIFQKTDEMCALKANDASL